MFYVMFKCYAYIAVSGIVMVASLKCVQYNSRFYNVFLDVTILQLKGRNSRTDL